MARKIIGLIGTLVAAGFLVWRLSVTSTLFDSPAGDGSQDRANLGTPAGALGALDQVAETLAALSGEGKQALVHRIEQATGQAMGAAHAAPSTTSAGGGRILTIEPSPAARAATTGDCALDGDAGGCTDTGTAAPTAPVTVFRPRR